MALLKLNQYVLAPIGNGKGIGEFHFALEKGDVCFVNADLSDDANLFLRALATLIRPEKGTYDFKGESLDFSDYRNLLPYKKRIAYISSFSRFISNRTLLENLLLIRSYFENSLSQELPESMMEMCRYLQIEDKLSLRPAQADPETLRLAVIVRELSKDPDFILIDGPRDFLGYKKFDLVVEVLRKMFRSGRPLVFSASDEAFAKEYSTKEVVIADGVFTVKVNRQ